MISKLFIEYHIKPNENGNRPTLSLTKTSIHSSIPLNQIFKIDSNGKTIFLFIEEGIDVEDLPKDSVSYLFLKNTFLVSQTEKITDMDVLSIEQLFSFDKICVSGNVDVNIDLDNSDTTIYALPYANVFINSTLSRLILRTFTFSKIVATGTAVSLTVSGIASQSTIDFSNINFEMFLRTVILNYDNLIGSLYMPMCDMDIMAVTLNQSISDFLKPVETSRQKFVREQIKIDYKENDLVSLKDEDISDDHCKICYNFMINTRFNPCGHTEMCISCASKIKIHCPNFTCPFCREEISSVEKIETKKIRKRYQPSSSSSSSSTSSLLIPSSSLDIQNQKEINFDTKNKRKRIF